MSKMFFSFLWALASLTSALDALVSPADSVLSFVSPAQAKASEVSPAEALNSSTIYCDVVASTFDDDKMQVKTIAKMQISDNEGTTNLQVSSNETLSIMRYFEWVRIELKQNNKDRVASASGSLQVDKTAITVELGIRNYYVTCRHK